LRCRAVANLSRLRCRDLDLLPFRPTVVPCRRHARPRGAAPPGPKPKESPPALRDVAGSHTLRTPTLWLRSDSLATNCCCRETLRHIGPQESHLSNCYYHQDLHWRSLHRASLPEASMRSCEISSNKDRHACLHLGLSHVGRGSSIRSTLERHPFSEQVDLVGELLHTP